MTLYSNQAKSSTSMLNQAVSDVSDTWDEMEDSWDDVEGTWDENGTQYDNDPKHSTSMTLQTKN